MCLVSLWGGSVQTILSRVPVGMLALLHGGVVHVLCMCEDALSALCVSNVQTLHLFDQGRTNFAPFLATACTPTVKKASLT